MQVRDRIKKLKRVKASSLKRNAKNWRTHPEAQQSALRGVLEEVGYAQALVARELEDGSLELIDGHLRADTAADDMIPVLVLDVTEEEADKLLASMDPIGAMAGANAQQLDALLRDIDTGSEALQQMLTDLAEEAGLYQDETPEVNEDEVPEPPVVPITKPGDLWLLGEHRVLCGDSTKAEDVARLMDGTKINIAFTSPPYASQRNYDESSGFKPIPPDGYVAWWDAVQANIANHLATDGSFFVNIKEHCEEGERHLYVKDLVIAHVRQWGWLFVDEFCWTHGGTPKAVVNRFKNGWEPIFQFTKQRHKFLPDNVRHASDSVVDWNGKHPSQKDGHGLRGEGVGGRQGFGDAVGARAAGAVVAGMAYPSNVLSVGKNREALGHGAAFPVGLPSFFIKAFADKGDTIYEPFCGSGTTLIAAEQLGRTCYGMEISPQYCDVVVKRWENLTGRKATLEQR